MQAVKQKIYKLVDTLPDCQLNEIANFIMFIKMRDEKNTFTGLEALSESSTDFWNNEVDDEVWNNA
ncbi:MAG: DUF2281 domain-containing protein [Defluviitaleaceae bacterium]|nr:DUF2281 domain-containing protein [Defluviitaleaceae bacterium]